MNEQYGKCTTRSTALPGFLEPSPSQSYPSIQVTASPQAGTRLKKDKERQTFEKSKNMRKVEYPLSAAVDPNTSPSNCGA